MANYGCNATIAEIVNSVYTKAKNTTHCLWPGNEILWMKVALDSCYMCKMQNNNEIIGAKYVFTKKSKNGIYPVFL